MAGEVKGYQGTQIKDTWIKPKGIGLRVAWGDVMGGNGDKYI